MHRFGAFCFTLLLVSVASATPPKASSPRPHKGPVSAATRTGRVIPRRARVNPAPSARFLGHEPIGPLALVSGGRVSQPERGACRNWGEIGSKWRELDAYGRVAGQVVVTSGDFYDVSRCYELGVQRLQGHAGAGIYVSAESVYAPPAFEPYSLSNHQKARVQKAASLAQTPVALLDAETRIPFANRFLSFSQKGTSRPMRWAVVGGRSLVVLRESNGQWIVEHLETPRGNKALEAAYKPLMITDMNADGMPEVVVHALEDWGESFGDLTLSRALDGKWTVVKPGIYGSTAAVFKTRSSPAPIFSVRGC